MLSTRMIQLDTDGIERYRRRITSIYLDAFTTGSYIHNQGILTQSICWSHLSKIMGHDGVCIIALTSIMESNEDVLSGLVFGCNLAFDDLLSSTSIPDTMSLDRYRYIAELAVHRDFRSMGIGRQLVQEHNKIVKSHSVDGVLVRTNEHDSGLHRFYESCGFMKMSEVGLQHGKVYKRYFCTYSR